MSKLKKKIFYIGLLILTSFNVYSASFLESKHKLPNFLYINEICFIPEKADGFVWIELWNHTKQSLNLKDYIMQVPGKKFKIENDFIIKPEKLGIVVFYQKKTIDDDFESRIPSETQVYRFFNVKLFKHGFLYNPEKQNEHTTDNKNDFYKMNLQIFDYKGEAKALMFSDTGTIYNDNQKKECIVYEPSVNPSFSFNDCELYKGATLLLTQNLGMMHLLTPQSSTPGDFYPDNVQRPKLSVFFHLPSGLSPNDENIDSEYNEPGEIYLVLDRTNINPYIDYENGWSDFVVDIAYDEKFKHKLFEKNKKIYMPDDFFNSSIQFTFEDYLYLIKRTLYGRIGRKNIDGRIVWSNTVEFSLPNTQILCNDLGGLTISDILKSKNEINYYGDNARVEKIKLLIEKLKGVINTLGVSDLMDMKGDGRLQEIEISNDLNTVWMSFSIYGIECLKTSENRQEDANMLRKVKDFSFLKTFDCYGADFSGTDMDDIGGLKLLIQHLPKDNLTGLRLVACNISDIAPLKKLKLKELNLSRNDEIRNLTPLSGMPLKKLEIAELEYVNLADLAECDELENITLTPSNCKNLESLKELPKLKYINGKTVKDFFDKYLN